MDSAQTETGIERDIQHCAQIKSRTERLICYDALALKIGIMPASKAEREQEIIEKYGFWTVTKRRSAAGETIIYLKNSTVEEVEGDAGLRRNPELVIMCRSGKTDVYIDWKSSLSRWESNFAGHMLVTIQFGNGREESVNWELSTDKRALFVPEPVEFVKKLRLNKQVILKLLPPQKVLQTLVYDLSETDAALETLVENCYR